MNIDTEVVKELSAQLATLYGHAVADVMPIVLDAISLIFLGKSIASFMGLLSAGFTLWLAFKWFAHIENKIEKGDLCSFDREPYVTFSCIVLAIFVPTVIYVTYSITMNILYAVAPHAYIVSKALGV